MVPVYHRLSYAVKEASDEEHGNGAVSRADSVVSSGAAEAAADALLDFCARQGATAEENLI